VIIKKEVQNKIPSLREENLKPKTNTPLEEEGTK